jgi:hypothetical protein
MHKFPIYEYKTFQELPLDKFNSFKFSVYLLDFDWNYLFVNDFVKENLGERAKSLAGKNMWIEFPELASDSVFMQLREKMEKRITCHFETNSPVTGQRLQVTGYPLEDCYYFTSSILPDKQELLNELRMHLTKRK